MSQENRLTTRKWRRRLLAVGIGVLVACLIGEVALRAGGYDRLYFNPLHSFHEADDLVGYRGKPNFRGRFNRLEQIEPRLHRFPAIDPPSFRKAVERACSSDA